MRFKFLGPLCLAAALLPTVAHAQPLPPTYYFQISQGSEAFDFHIDSDEVGAPGTLDPVNFSSIFEATGDSAPEELSFGIGTDSGSEGIGLLPIAFLTFDTPSDVSSFYTGNGTTARFGLGTYDLTAVLGPLEGEYQLQVADTPFVSAVPEPSSFALLGTGILGIAGAFRRRIFS